MKFVSWIRFRVRRQWAMMDIIMLHSITLLLEGMVAARMSAGEVFGHCKKRSRRRMYCEMRSTVWWKLNMPKAYKQTSSWGSQDQTTIKFDCATKQKTCQHHKVGCLSPMKWKSHQCHMQTYPQQTTSPASSQILDSKQTPALASWPDPPLRT